MAITIAVPISWPTTITPTVAWRPISLTLEIDFSRPLVSTSTTNLPLLYWSSQAASPLERGSRRASSLPIRTALPWTCFWILSGGERLEQGGARFCHRRVAEVDLERQGARGLLGLDDRLHRQGQLAVELKAVVEDCAQEGAERVPERARPCRTRGTGGPADRCRRGTPPRRSRGSACRGRGDRHRSRDVDLLDRVDQPEQVDPLLRGELADEAEIEEDDLTRLRHDEDVARVRVAVEEAVDQDLLDDRPDEDGAQLGRVEARGAQLVRLGDLDAVDVTPRS